MVKMVLNENVSTYSIEIYIYTRPVRIVRGQVPIFLRKQCVFQNF